MATVDVPNPQIATELSLGFQDSVQPGEASLLPPLSLPTPLRADELWSERDLEDGVRKHIHALNPHQSKLLNKDSSTPTKNSRGSGHFFCPQYTSVVNWEFRGQEVPREE